MKKVMSVGLGITTAIAFSHATFAGVMSVPPVQPATMYQTVADIPMKVWSHNSANLRAKPTTDSKVLARLKPGTTTMVIEKVSGGSWVHVRVNGIEGYVDSRLLNDM